VILERQEGEPFGLSICGPTSVEDESAGIFVASLADNSVAGRTDLLSVGDQIVRINKHNVRLATVEDAMSLMKQSGNTMTLTIASNVEGFAQYRDDIHEVTSEVRKVQLVSSSCDYGFTLIGGVEHGTDVFVTVIHAGGVAEEDGRLLVGDQLLTVNEVEVDGMLLEQV
jgi:C-terminal processing protease CtpA/Prc